MFTCFGGAALKIHAAAHSGAGQDELQRTAIFRYKSWKKFSPANPPA
jgi:hypothetical protein